MKLLSKLFAVLCSSMMSAAIILPTAVFAADNGKGTVKITIIDEETGELFNENSSGNFWVIGGVKCAYGAAGAICVDGWNSYESNPHVITDIPNVSEQWSYVVQYCSRDYDGYTYSIDEEKSNCKFNFSSGLEQDITIYMKKHYWSVDPDANKETASFEQLYSMSEEELQKYCNDHNIPYISRDEAIHEIRCGAMPMVMVRVDNYKKPNIEDKISSYDANELNTSNTNDYDFEKILKDLNFSEAYYKIVILDFMIYADGDENIESEDDELIMKYTKLAMIGVAPNYKSEDNMSYIRLYQLIGILAEQCPEVQSFFKDYPAGINPKIGDMNGDEIISVADAVIMQKYLVNSYTLSEKQLIFGDMNGDGKIDVFDLCTLKRQLCDK